MNNPSQIRTTLSGDCHNKKRFAKIAYDKMYRDFLRSTNDISTNTIFLIFGFLD